MSMKRKIVISFFCVLVVGMATCIPASAHTSLSTVKSSVEQTQWDIYEKGYVFKENEDDEGIEIPYHSSGNGIMIKTDPTLLTKSCFVNIASCITHAKNAWTNATFNGTKIFNNKIKEVANSYSLTTSDTSNQKTLVKVYSEYDSSSNYWGRAIISTSPATYYTSTSSGTHLKTCRIRLNEYSLGSSVKYTDSQKLVYQKYTLTHELGHIIGLADLSTKFSDNKYSDYLMGYQNWSLQAPTATDMQGAAVISGYHTVHSNFKYNYRTKTLHEKRCGLCNGYVLEKHTVSGGKCTKCNRTIS